MTEPQAAAAEAADVVLYDVPEPHVAVVRLNRPAKRNAVDGALAAALGRIVQMTEADPAIRAVVLTSATPGMFSAGADLGEVARGNGRALFTEGGGFAGVTEAARDKPWIAAIDGPALAGGCEIALSCDMIVASDAARFGLPEVKRGLFAAAGGVQRLPRALPRNIALELIATGDGLPAERAYTLGLVNRLVPSAEVVATAVQLAAIIAANAPVSVVESLKLARLADDLGEAELRAAAAAATRIVMRTADSREGPRAFLEKRAPAWQGK